MQDAAHPPNTIAVVVQFWFLFQHEPVNRLWCINESFTLVLTIPLPIIQATQCAISPTEVKLSQT